MFLLKADRDLIIRRYGTLKAEFEIHRPTFLAIRDACAAGLGRNLSGSSEEEDTKSVTDSFKKTLDIAGTESRLILASGLMSGMTPQSRPWFRLGATYDPELNRYKPVAEYLSAVTKIMDKIFRVGGIYHILPALYGEIAAFGTAAAFIAPDPTTVVQGKPLTIGEYYIAQDHRGSVDTLYRNIFMTADQIISAFGIENCPLPVIEAYKKGSRAMFKVIHAVEPNDDRLTLQKEIKLGRPYRSIYLMESVSDEKVGALAIDGFDIFPAVVPRWLRIGNSPYGIGCGHLALGSANLLYTEKARWIKLLDRASGSPLIAPSSMRDVMLNLQTDEINYVADNLLSGSQMPIRPIFDESLNYGPLREAIADSVNQVERAFHKQLFLMYSNLEREATATEILKRDQERITVLGPVLDNLNTELLDRMIQIVYVNMLSTGTAPEMPPELAGQEIGIEYIGAMATAQKLASVDSTSQMLGLLGNLSGMYPEVKFKLNPIELVNMFAEILGIDPRIIYSDEDANKAYEAEIAQAQQMQAAQSLPMAADVTQKLASAQTEDGTVLDRMAKGAQG